MSIRNRTKWNDDELAASLDAYLYMLQLECSSIPFSAEKYSESLLSGPLHRRNRASVRYRMRNISAVMADRNLPRLRAFSSAAQVGSGVRERLNHLLDARNETLERIRDIQSSIPSSGGLDDVLRSLDDLKSRLSQLENSRPAGIGHNNPPGEIDISREELRDAASAIEKIRQEVRSDTPDRDRVNTLSDRLKSLGLKAFVWAGQRVTDFAKAGAVAAGSGFGLHISGLGEQILATLRTVLNFLL